MNELYDVLKTSKASDFLIREEQTESREAFFIGQKLDMSRAKKVTHTFLTVFVDSEDGKFRGSAEKEIHQGISREEMKQEIDQALFAAQFVQNPWYPVAEPSDAQASADMADASRDLTAELVKLVQAMQEIKAEEDSRVNSYEIFVNQKQTHIRNSRGVDVTFSGFDCEIEVVTNSRKDDHEIEIYKDLRFSDKSAEKIIAEVRGMFHTGRQRLNAVPTRQNEHADVLLTGNAVGSFFQYFAMHTNYDVLGMAELSGQILGLTDTEVLDVTMNTQTKEEGIGRVGSLPKEMTLEECCVYVKHKLKLGSVKVFGDMKQPVKRLAVSPGSGKSAIAPAVSKGADVLVTGDIGHHEGLDAAAQGVSVIDAGHYGTEYIFMEDMKERLAKAFPEFTVSCAKVRSPYTIL